MNGGEARGELVTIAHHLTDKLNDVLSPFHKRLTCRLESHPFQQSPALPLQQCAMLGHVLKLTILSVLAFSLSQGPYDMAWATFQLPAHLGFAHHETVGCFCLIPAGPPNLDNAVDWVGRCLFFFFFFWEMTQVLGRNDILGRKRLLLTE